MCFLSNAFEVVNRERAGRVCTHVQVLNTKVNAVRTSTNGCCQTLWGTNGGHYLWLIIHKIQFN